MTNKREQRRERIKALAEARLQLRRAGEAHRAELPRLRLEGASIATLDDDLDEASRRDFLWDGAPGVPRDATQELVVSDAAVQLSLYFYFAPRGPEAVA